MFNHLDRGDTMDVDVPADGAAESDYAGLVLPGGVANPISCALTRRPSRPPAASSLSASPWRPSATRPGL